MKKLITLATSAALLAVSFGGCNQAALNDSSTIKNHTEAEITEKKTQNSYEIYRAVIDTYREVVEQERTSAKDYLSDASYTAAKTNSNGELEEIIFGVLDDSAVFPRPDGTYASVGYAFADLNGNGSDELILFSGGRIIAIFSAPDGAPKLLIRFMRNRTCFVMQDGRLHIEGSGVVVGTTQTLELSPDDRELLLIEEFGFNDLDEFGEVILYKLVDGEKQRISKDEFDSISSKYPVEMWYTEHCNSFGITPISLID